MMAILFAILTAPVSAQVPNTLKHSIAPPPTGVQEGAQLGSRVAVEGGYTVVGALWDDTGASGAGVVKVFNSSTGALLFVIPNPSPEDSDNFGVTVAISGTLVVVGAYGDNTGAGRAGSAYVYDLSSGTATVPVATLNNPSPAASESFGTCVAISGTKIVVGAIGDNTGASRTGSAYVYDLTSGTPTVPIATLNNPSPADDDSFGVWVGISGSRVVVGALYDDTGASDAGSAYVFDLNSGTPAVPVVTLNNPSPAAQDWFGKAVGISGTKVVVGAPNDDTGASNAGTVYVYDIISATPTVPVATINNPTPGNGGSFGNFVAISGARIVSGVRNNVSASGRYGTAHVYDLGSGTPTVPVMTLNNPGPDTNSSFGFSGGIFGTQLVVGAPDDNTIASYSGSACVYDLGSATPTIPVATLRDSGPAPGDLFGTSVAVSGARMVVGAPYDDTGAGNAGRAYVYDLTSRTPLVPVATLNNPSPEADDYFGTSVAIFGSRVVVGAYRDYDIAFSSGSAYVYDLSSGTPTVPVAMLRNPSPAANDYFGYSVAISGTRVVIGAYQDDTGATNAGSAYVYDLNSGAPTVPMTVLNNPSPAANDYFGWSVAISGTRVVVGAYGDDTGATDGGSAYVYDLSSGTPTGPISTLNNPSPAVGDQFAYSVAISGTRATVGAPFDDTGATDAGSAYVYDLSSGTPAVPVATLNNPGPAVNDRLGSAVAISGTRVVVGAHQDDTGTTDAGSAYVYDLSSGAPTVPVATLNNPSPAVGDYFGWAVAIDGMTVAIGAPKDDTVMLNKGYAYVFGPASNDFDNDGLLDIWEYARFGSISAHSGLDDSDGDGRVELLEQAFNTNPLLPDVAGAPQAVNEGGYLTMTIAKRAGVSYSVQSAATPDGASFSAATTTVLVNDATTLKVRDNVVVGSPLSRFMRVRVTAAP